MILHAVNVSMITVATWCICSGSIPSSVRSSSPASCKLQAKVGDLPASDRSIRRYVRTLKEEVASAQQRYYEPILDDIPGVQCQVDPGELRSVQIGGEERPLYFVVFVLSYSRLMYVGLSFRPLDTQTFIQLHDEALRYFDGLPEECVYDQCQTGGDQ